MVASWTLNHHKMQEIYEVHFIDVKNNNFSIDYIIWSANCFVQSQPNKNLYFQRSYIVLYMHYINIWNFYCIFYFSTIGPYWENTTFDLDLLSHCLFLLSFLTFVQKLKKVLEIEFFSSSFSMPSDYFFIVMLV